MISNGHLSRDSKAPYWQTLEIISPVIFAALLVIQEECHLMSACARHRPEMWIHFLQLPGKLPAGDIQLPGVDLHSKQITRYSRQLMSSSSVYLHSYSVLRVAGVCILDDDIAAARRFLNRNRNLAFRSLRNGQSPC